MRKFAKHNTPSTLMNAKLGPELEGGDTVCTESRARKSSASSAPRRPFVTEWHSRARIGGYTRKYINSVEEYHAYEKKGVQIVGSIEYFEGCNQA
ncbi:hypothetical protein HDE_05335 [Halotydeus destructor]|nr:hypothetical protein HDE_05335 [Halotydeus destructor]